MGHLEPLTLALADEVADGLLWETPPRRWRAHWACWSGPGRGCRRATALAAALLAQAGCGTGELA